MRTGGRAPLVTAFLAALLGACGGAAEGPAPRPSLLLVTVDTLRADHLGAYGAPGDPTPSMDALARSGALFERAAAPMPMTRPSHFSMLTGMYPREHGVVNNAIALPDEALTLQEMLAERGYRTGAFVAVVLLDETSGAEQGFGALDGPARRRERPASEVVPRALDWLDTVRRGEPFFLWVHLFDPHLPYAPPPAFRRAAGVDPELDRRFPAGLSWEALEEIAAANGGDVPREILEHARALYRGEVRAVDRAVGGLLAGLEARGRAADTAVLLTADHGESFGQGVYFEHADALFESTLRVPLIARWPEDFPPGARVGAQVSVVDVAPTLLRIAGLPIPPGLSGRPLQEAGSFEDRYVLVQHPLYQQRAAEGRARRGTAIRSVAGDPIEPILVGAERAGLVGRDWRIVREGKGVEVVRLPDEAAPADPAAAGVREDLERELDAALERHPLRLVDPGHVNPELRATLEALGYGS